MKQITVIMFGVASVVLMILSCVSTQAPTTAAPKAGRPLVKHLPAKIEGVELVGGTVRAKPGYKFVKQPNGSVTVARMGGGGLGIGGTFDCSCVTVIPAPPGLCVPVITANFLYCAPGAGCQGYCQLITTPGPGLRRMPIIAY